MNEEDNESSSSCQTSDSDNEKINDYNENDVNFIVIINLLKLLGNSCNFVSFLFTRIVFY